jgi:hypothetical protein
MFKRSSVRYGRTPAPETPYQKAAQVWDERIGSARIQAGNWRLMAFGCLLLSGGLASGLVWQSVRGTVTPWVVQVDRLGLAQAVAPADGNYQPTDPQIAFAKLVQSAPWIDTKFCAATQVLDEARHMEVYAKYLREKLEWEFPVNVHLRSLLNDIVQDSRWDFTFLGMQVVIEGLALAAFGFQYQLTKDPLLKQITRYIMADEARHVAFGVLSLREVYAA